MEDCCRFMVHGYPQGATRIGECASTADSGTQVGQMTGNFSFLAGT